MSLMLVYEAVKEKLGTMYPNIFYQNMREDIEGDVGIYLYESSNDMEDLGGGEVYNAVKVHIQINSVKSVKGMQKALDYLTNFTYRIEKEDSAVSNISFVEAKHIGPRAIAIGKNEYGIMVCRSVIDLKYVYGN